MNPPDLRSHRTDEHRTAHERVTPDAALSAAWHRARRPTSLLIGTRTPVEAVFGLLASGCVLPPCWAGPASMPDPPSTPAPHRFAAVRRLPFGRRRPRRVRPPRMAAGAAAARQCPAVRSPFKFRRWGKVRSGPVGSGGGANKNKGGTSAHGTRFAGAKDGDKGLSPGCPVVYTCFQGRCFSVDR